MCVRRERLRPAKNRPGKRDADQGHDDAGHGRWTRWAWMALLAPLSRCRCRTRSQCRRAATICKNGGVLGVATTPSLPLVQSRRRQSIPAAARMRCAAAHAPAAGEPALRRRPWTRGHEDDTGQGCGPRTCRRRPWTERRQSLRMRGHRLWAQRRTPILEQRRRCRPCTRSTRIRRS